MKLSRTTGLIACALGCTLLFSATTAAAEPLHRHYHKHGVHTHRVVNKVVVTRPAPVRTVAALSLASLPVGYARIVHDGDTYYFSEGRYYQKRSHGFVVVTPRAGFRVTTLPRGYTVVRERGVTFYSFNNVRYRKVDGLFVVV